MTRVEVLGLLLNQAQFNGFEFRNWYQANIQSSWPGTELAIDILSREGRYYCLLFSHEFAQCFWRTGSAISFRVPSITYSRVNGKGEVVEVKRKPFTRRSVKADVWKYHLRQMAEAENPIEYLCRFLPIADQERLETCRDALARKASHKGPPRDEVALG